MTEYVRQLLHVLIALGMLAAIAVGTCPRTTVHRDADPRANAVDLAPSEPTRHPRS
ncbi:hypothetical protein ACFXPI_07165 [Streptomyces sp. NPDC059104]|uniref:hypothetical protein n=1 Tax=Streptomyces sp. NPDC059104 TaxID=3346729 RepID=UPI0036A25D64